MYLNITGHDSATSSLFDTTVTYANNQYSCHRSMYFLHLIFNYFIFLSGIVCLATRPMPLRFRWIHSWSGRVYIMSMLWSTVVSILIHTDGLSLATLISFYTVVGCLCIAWISIVLHKQGLERSAMTRAQEKLEQAMMALATSKEDGALKSTASEKGRRVDLTGLLQEAKQEAIESQSLYQKFVSFKSLHGILFFVSWFQIAGRMFSSDQSGNFTCRTYPAYKPHFFNDNSADLDGEMTVVQLLPTNDPNYSDKPWSGGEIAWSTQIIGGSAVFAMLVSAAVCWRVTVRDKRLRKEGEMGSRAAMESFSPSKMGADETTDDHHNASDTETPTKESMI